MWQRIASLFARRPVTAPEAPAVVEAPQATAGEGAAPPPAVPVHAVGDLPAIDTLRAAAAGLTPRDIQRLAGVHPDLVRVVIRARASVPFFVIEGLRTAERQALLYAEGKSKTLQSRHITGHAVDLAPWDDRDRDGQIDRDEVAWSDKAAFGRLAGAIRKAALAENVPIRWGGEFKGFYDGPHFELPRASYPA